MGAQAVARRAPAWIDIFYLADMVTQHKWLHVGSYVCRASDGSVVSSLRAGGWAKGASSVPPRCPRVLTAPLHQNAMSCQVRTCDVH